MYKIGIGNILSYANRIYDEPHKVSFNESRFSQDFQHIIDCCHAAISLYHDNGNISSPLEQLNTFFIDNEKELKHVDLSEVTKAYQESEFDRLIFEVFNNYQFPENILDVFILHLCIILDFKEFQLFFRSYECFENIHNRFMVYVGRKGELFIITLMKLFRCQYQYESTFLAIFRNFNEFSLKIFNINHDPIFNYQFTAIIISITNSKRSKELVDPNIILNINSNHQNIINVLPPFPPDNNDCLLYLYLIYKKMVKNDNDKFINFLRKQGKLDLLLSPPINDSNELKISRIDLFRVCLLSFHMEQDKRNFLNSTDFDFPMIIACTQSNNPKYSSKLIIASLKFLIAFIPDLVDELFNYEQNRYYESTIISFANDILSQGEYKEKKITIEFLTALINANTNYKYKFIRELINIDMDEDNIFISLNNLMQTDEDTIKFDILRMIQSLFIYFERKPYKELRNKMVYLIKASGLENDFYDHLMSEDESIRDLSQVVLNSLIYHGNLTKNTNF